MEEDEEEEEALEISHWKRRKKINPETTNQSTFANHEPIRP